MLRTLRRLQLLHRLAMLCHRHNIEALILALLALAFQPERAKIGLELAVHTDMVHRIIAIVAHSINFLDAQSLRQTAQTIEHKILRAIAKECLRQALDQLIAVLRSLQSADIDNVLAILILAEPEHNLIQSLLLIVHHQRQAAFLTLSGVKHKIQRQRLFLILILPQLYSLALTIKLVQHFICK